MLGINEMALMLFVIAPFIYMIINYKYKYEIVLNREQRRKKKIGSTGKGR